MKDTASLISFVVHLLFVYGKATEFCVLTLRLVRVFISYRSFSERYLKGHLNVRSYHLHIKLLWLLPFLFFFPLVVFSCLIALAKIPNAVLIRYGEDNLVLFLILVEILEWNFFSFRLMIDVGAWISEKSIIRWPANHFLWHFGKECGCFLTL